MSRGVMQYLRQHAVAVAGASGRMGQLLIDTVRKADDMKLTVPLYRVKRELGTMAEQLRLKKDLEGTDYLIDFTRPQGTLKHLLVCQEMKIKMVIGTTGFDAAQIAQIKQAAQDIAIVMAPNMSVGVNVTLKLLEMAAKALDASYDVEIVEAHHRHKVDAPSGTAFKMGEIVAQARGERLGDPAVCTRYGETGARTKGSIGFATIRGGDIVGEHTVMFCGEGERIEVSHKSSSRAGYASGSLKAVRFLAQRNAGLYDMFDVLGLRQV